MSDFQLHTPETHAGLRRPFVEVAVVMRRERIDNRWQPWRWSLSEIIPHEAGFGSAPRLLLVTAAPHSLKAGPERGRLF